MEIETLKQKLTSERDTLLEELKTLGTPNPKTEGDWVTTTDEPSDAEPDPNSLGDRSEEWQERRGTLVVLETRLGNINRTLKKFEDNSYGICELCKEPIENDRLEANAAARTCKTHINDEAKLAN